MKLGLIIICQNNEKDINKDYYVMQLNKVNDLKICLVNNNCKDNIHKVLIQIQEQCDNISVINIKKIKSDISAVRAGARYMFNQFNLDHIGYVLNLNNFNIKELIEAIRDNKDAIINFNINALDKTEIRLTKFQRLFSIIDYLKRLEIKFSI